MKSKAVWLLMLMITVSWSSLSFYAQDATACKVLVVMQFSEDFFWTYELTQGIEDVLKDRCELRYTYLDAEKNPAGVGTKAQEAYALYQEWQPDGVMASDDVTQAVFVVPYLKEKVATPVIVAQVYNPPAYGYPAANVTGVIGMSRMKESLTFLLQLVPSVKTIGTVLNDNETSRAGMEMIAMPAGRELGLTMLDPFFSNDHAEILVEVEKLKTTADAIFTAPSVGEGMIEKIVKTFGKPTLTAWSDGIRRGVLCGVIESGVEVGKLAAQKMAQVLDGTPIADIPMDAPEFGTRMINVNTLKVLGLEPSRRLLTGVELIKE